MAENHRKGPEHNQSADTLGTSSLDGTHDQGARAEDRLQRGRTKEAREHMLAGKDGASSSRNAFIYRKKQTR